MTLTRTLMREGKHHRTLVSLVDREGRAFTVCVSHRIVALIFVMRLNDSVNDEYKCIDMNEVKR